MTKRKGKWSKEAKERQSKMMKERFGKKPEVILPSMTRLMEYQPETEERISEELMNKTDRYISKRAFDYDQGVRFEHGEVVELRGLPNDAKLKSTGFLILFEGKESDLDTCIQCSKQFATTSGYSMHTAKHYKECGICKTKIAPEVLEKHIEAHRVLA